MSAPYDSVISHMNRDHSSSLLSYAKYFGQIPTASRAILEDLTLEDFGLSVHYGELGSDNSNATRIRIRFPSPLSSASKFREVFILMDREAAEALSEGDGTELPKSPGEAKAASAEKNRRISAAHDETLRAAGVQKSIEFNTEAAADSSSGKEIGPTESPETPKSGDWKASAYYFIRFALPIAAGLVAAGLAFQRSTRH